jgi:protease-4
MQRLARLSLLLASMSGCLNPIKVITEDRVSLTGPVTAELVPTSSDRPVVGMAVEGGTSACGRPHIAIVDVDRLLLNTNLTGPYSTGDNPVDLFREKLDAAAADACAVALVVRINSPGGSVTATDMMWSELQSFRGKTRRPVVACLLDVGTGGAYYLATASDLIIAHPTTITGGIGGVINLFNLEDTMNVLNAVTQSIKAGTKIDLGTVTRALEPEEEEILQGLADEFHGRFRSVVLQQRPHVNPGVIRKPDAEKKQAEKAKPQDQKPDGQKQPGSQKQPDKKAQTEAVNKTRAEPETFDGRIFSASQAKQRGLIDQISYLEDALAQARALAGQPNAGAVILHRHNPARTPFATTPNVPLQTNLFPASFPGLDRSKLPTFLDMWLPDPTPQYMAAVAFTA